MTPNRKNIPMTLKICRLMFSNVSIFMSYLITTKGVVQGLSIRRCCDSISPTKRLPFLASAHNKKPRSAMAVTKKIKQRKALSKSAGWGVPSHGIGYVPSRALSYSISTLSENYHLGLCLFFSTARTEIYTPSPLTLLIPRL